MYACACILFLCLVVRKCTLLVTCAEKKNIFFSLIFSVKRVVVLWNFLIFANEMKLTVLENFLKSKNQKVVQNRKLLL